MIPATWENEDFRALILRDPVRVVREWDFAEILLEHGIDSHEKYITFLRNGRAYGYVMVGACYLLARMAV